MEDASSTVWVRSAQIAYRLIIAWPGHKTEEKASQARYGNLPANCGTVTRIVDVKKSSDRGPRDQALAERLITRRLGRAYQRTAEDVVGVGIMLAAGALVCRAEMVPDSQSSLTKIASRLLRTLIAAIDR